MGRAGPTRPRGEADGGARPAPREQRWAAGAATAPRRPAVRSGAGVPREEGELVVLWQWRCSTFPLQPERRSGARGHARVQAFAVSYRAPPPPACCAPASHGVVGRIWRPACKAAPARGPAGRSHRMARRSRRRRRAARAALLHRQPQMPCASTSPTRSARQAFVVPTSQPAQLGA